MCAHHNLAAAGDGQEPVDGRVVAAAAQTLRQLADPTRFHLLALLTAGSQDVSTLTAQVEASRSAVSQHLGRLRLAGLVTASREGRRMRYRLADEHVRELVTGTYALAGNRTGNPARQLGRGS